MNMARWNDTTTDDDSAIVLTYEEAHQRAWETAEQLEELIGQYTDEPYERDETRVASFAADCLAFLADDAVIIPPYD